MYVDQSTNRVCVYLNSKPTYTCDAYLCAFWYVGRGCHFPNLFAMYGSSAHSVLFSSCARGDFGRRKKKKSTCFFFAKSFRPAGVISCHGSYVDPCALCARPLPLACANRYERWCMYLYLDLSYSHVYVCIRQELCASQLTTTITVSLLSALHGPGPRPRLPTAINGSSCPRLSLAGGPHSAGLYVL